MSQKPPTFESTLHAYQSARLLRDPRAAKLVRIVHISDTHGEDYDDLPSGDILVHTGDFTNHGTKTETDKFCRYLERMQHKFEYMVIVCGNHEMGYDRLSNAQILDILSNSGQIPNIYFLQDSGALVKGVRFWGSSWNNCCAMAWSASPEVRAKKWDSIPPDTDILLTHNPPEGILDLAWVRSDSGPPCPLCNGRKHRNFRHWGCKALRERIQNLKIPVHMFGHVHDQIGIVHVKGMNTTFSNAAMDIKQRCSVVDVLVADDSICSAASGQCGRATGDSSALPSSVASSLLMRGLKFVGAQ